MLTVGTDTYVSVSDATNYINSNYLSSDERVTAWENLSESDKEVFLRRACAEIDKVKYRGVIFEAFQPLAFPRFFETEYTMAYRELIAPLAYVYPELKDVPPQVIYAQIEEAFELACPSSDTAINESINGAVESFSIGHFSERYKTAAVGSLESIIKSQKAQAFLKPFAEGSYDII